MKEATPNRRKSAHRAAAQRNRYRHPDVDTRAGTIDRGPRAVQGTYFLEWLLQRRKRVESALINAAADGYLAGIYTRRMDDPAHLPRVEVTALPDGHRPGRARRGVPSSTLDAAELFTSWPRTRRR